MQSELAGSELARARSERDAQMTPAVHAEQASYAHQAHELVHIAQPARAGAPPGLGRLLASLGWYASLPRSIGMRVLLSAVALGGVAGGLLALAVVAFAGAEGSPAAAAPLLILWGAGVLAGRRLFALRAWRLPPPLRFVASGCAFAASMVAPAVAAGMASMAAALIVSGSCLGAWLACGEALVAELDDQQDDLGWRALGIKVVIAGVAAGALLGGMLAAMGGARLALATAVLSAAGAALVASARRDTLRRPSPRPPGP